MKCRKTILLLIILLILLSLSASAEWQDNLTALLAAESETKQDELITEIVAADPDFRDVIAAIRATEFPEVEGRGEFQLLDTLCIDNKTRPWVLYIPEDYDPTEPTPLMVVLHGGVNSVSLAPDPLGYAEGRGLSMLGREYGMLLIFPMGQAGATWWDKVGMGNIANLVRIVKRGFNVDDDRVYMGGFSDGASAAFFYAMALPNDYAGFVALNGHMGVGSMDGGAAIYPINFSNSPVYATTTDRDNLYSTEKMKPTIEMARDAGANIYHRELEGTHSFDFAEAEVPLISEYLNAHKRIPAPAEFVWEAAITKYCRYHWFVIDGIAEGEREDWHKEYNTTLLSDRITIGFTPDDYDGAGVKVGFVFEETVAAEIDLQSGDVIIKGDSLDIADMDGLYDWKNMLERGDEIEITILRGDDTLKLAGQLPEAEEYEIFVYDKPSALVKGSLADNRITIESSRLTAFKVLINPELFDLERNLIINSDGATVFDEPVQADIDYLLRDFLKNRDRKEIYVNEIRVEL